MADWTGLDPGGTEQLWDPDLLIGCLKIFKENEPFSRGDPRSPIYDDLEELYPDVTWRNFDQQKSFRPVFRKTNPWVKLNLISDETKDAYVTPLGDELLSGEKSLSEVFTEATKNHREPDGTPSYQVLCEFFLALPNETLTLEDVAFAVENLYLSGAYTAEEALKEVREKKLTFPTGSRQIRRLRSFMNCLVTAGAIQTTESGWILLSPKTASEIANTEFDESQVPSTEPPPTPEVLIRKIPQISRRPQTTTYVRKAIGTQSRSKVSSVAPSGKSYDPVSRALLLEKANSIHERLLVMCADVIRDLRFTPLEDPNSFDVACEEVKVIIEVKSINSVNAVSQFRKAIAQLPEYRWRHRDAFDESTRLIVVVNEDPKPHLDDEFLAFINHDRLIQIFWDKDGTLSDKNGVTLKEALALSQ